jgi:transcription termination/antitermination protein NusA
MVSLFKREVPEVDDGTVRLLGVSRDPGKRAKVAVYSKDRDVDPVGACVGVRGSRIHNIVQELKGERIDIVLWSPEVATYAANALSPARISRITVDEEEKKLEVVVPDDQLTLAIGRKGQNVKLASKLLGWKIDIFTESRYGDSSLERQGLEQAASVVGVSMDALFHAGFKSIAQLSEASDEELLQIDGLDEDKLSDLRAALNLLGSTFADREAAGARETAEGEEPAAVREEHAAGDGASEE